MEKTKSLRQEHPLCVPGTSQTPLWLEQSHQTEQSKGCWEPGHHSAIIQMSNDSGLDQGDSRRSSEKSEEN